MAVISGGDVVSPDRPVCVRLGLVDDDGLNRKCLQFWKFPLKNLFGANIRESECAKRLLILGLKSKKNTYFC